jgi:integrase
VSALPLPEPLFLFPAEPVQLGHCASAEYEAFIARLPYGHEQRRKQIAHQVRFARTYPQLPAWFERPLRERLGWRHGESQQRRNGPGEDFDPTIGWINFNARHYLLYLALAGRLKLDWAYLLGIGVLKPFTISDHLGLPLSAQAEEMRLRLIDLGHLSKGHEWHVSWGLIRLVLHRSDPDISTITFAEVEEMRQVIKHADQVPELADVVGPERLETLRISWGTKAYRTGLALFHTGITEQQPVPYRGSPRPPLSAKPKVDALLERFLAERALVLRPGSMVGNRSALRRLGLWLDENRPDLESLGELTRADMVEFMQDLGQMRKIKHPGEVIGPAYRASIISFVAVFFRHAALAEWPDAPARPLITHSDMPLRTARVPRFIPGHQLDPVMDGIRDLQCPLQRTALLIARWSGARRSEIRRLHLDCLDAYPDGTARLRLAAGKSRKERTVPVHDEAAEAIRALVAIRQKQGDRGLLDPDLGERVRYLFLRNGALAHPEYLFAAPLRTICAELDLLDGEGRAAIHPHRFRHTLGTQLAEKGARMQTIMKILGHASPGMSMTYTHISDPTVLADYQAVLQPGAVIAGPLAETLRAGKLDQQAVDWLKTNFYKTELELGHCLRLPQEGPCECDLYLSCAKFVTTPEYAPRLRERLCTEDRLTADAHERGWQREVERHQRIGDRIRNLLDELGEPYEGSEQ